MHKHDEDFEEIQQPLVSISTASQSKNLAKASVVKRVIFCIRDFAKWVA